LFQRQKQSVSKAETLFKAQAGKTKAFGQVAESFGQKRKIIGMFYWTLSKKAVPLRLKLKS